MSLTRHIDCENNQESLLSLVKRIIVQDDSGNWYVRVCPADATVTPVSILTEIECNDKYKFFDAIFRNLICVNDDGDLCLAVYEAE